MKTRKLIIIGFGIMALTLVIATTSHAQKSLNGVWFKVKVSMKEYDVPSPDDIETKMSGEVSMSCKPL